VILLILTGEDACKRNEACRGIEIGTRSCNDDRTTCRNFGAYEYEVVEINNVVRIGLAHRFPVVPSFIL
jgi:hypothetical protein